MASNSIFLEPDPAMASMAPVPASDRVRFGMIGVGMQGSALLDTSYHLPGVDCAASCDLYDGRHTLAREITRADLPVTRRYQDLLNNKEIDCIVAAVPDHWHKRIVVDAVNAGKDIYCEKPMSHTAAEGVEMADAQKKTGRIVQIGSQRVSSAICAKAKEIVAKGTLGDLMLVEGSLGRNDPTGAWEYPPPPTFRRRRSTGTHGKTTSLSEPSTHDLRPLALLEGIWHRCRRRSTRPPRQWHDVHPQHQ